MTWERDNAKRGKVSTRVLKSDRQFKDHKKYCRYRTKTEEKCVTPIVGAIRPKIATYSDEHGIKERVQKLGEKFSIGISEMQTSYGNLLRQVYMHDKFIPQEKRKTMEMEGELDE